jgi:hypothetical protein
MITKKYNKLDPGYFRNFVLSNDPEGIIEEGLAPYKATINANELTHLWYELTINWHDEQLYTLFVLRYA